MSDHAREAIEERHLLRARARLRDLDLLMPHDPPPPNVNHGDLRYDERMAREERVAAWTGGPTCEDCGREYERGSGDADGSCWACAMEWRDD